VRVVLWVLADMLEAVRTGQAEAHQTDQAEVLGHIGQVGDREEPQIGRYAVADDPWEGIVREEALEEGVLRIVGRILAELRSLLLIIQHLSIERSPLTRRSSIVLLVRRRLAVALLSCDDCQ
jgi:hypothetical protein